MGESAGSLGMTEHTGYLRETHLFAILGTGWPEAEARLRPAGA